MTIKAVHDIILFYLNKAQQGYITHEEIDSVLDRAQLALFNQYHTNPKLPSNVALSVYGDSQRIDDALSPFKVNQTFINQTSITLPSDYMHLLSLYTTTYNSSLGRNTYNGVQILDEQELILRLESQIIPVSIDDPIAIMAANNTIQLFPNTAQSGGYYYFRRPKAPKFNYTISNRVVTEIFNQGVSTSIDLEWREFDISNIICIALSYYGLNIKSADVIQFAQTKTQEGQ
jgi:hypothetical protein